MDELKQELEKRLNALDSTLSITTETITTNHEKQIHVLLAARESDTSKMADLDLAVAARLLHAPWILDRPLYPIFPGCCLLYVILGAN